MKTERLHRDGKYVGSITTMSNGDRIRRDSHNNKVMTYKASTGIVRDSKGHRIGKI